MTVKKRKRVPGVKLPKRTSSNSVPPKLAVGGMVGAALGALLGISYAHDPRAFDPIFELIAGSLKGIIPDNEWGLGSFPTTGPATKAKPASKTKHPTKSNSAPEPTAL